VAGRRRHEPPGILGLLDLIEEHRAAFAYDWRTRFHLPLDALDDGRMSLAEACLLLRGLAADPSSHVAAALGGWSHPMSREALIAADTWDLLAAAHSDKKRRTKPYPRPWKSTGPRTSLLRNKRTRSQEEIRAILASRGPQPVEEVTEPDGR
jgi:hypothetical protein